MLTSIHLISLAALSVGAELPGAGERTIPEVAYAEALSVEEAISHNERLDALLLEMTPGIETASARELLLYVKMSESRRRQDLVLSATKALPLEADLADAWMARGRALASVGEYEEAEALLREVQRSPALSARVRGLRGILAFAHDRAGRHAEAAGHGRAHCLELLRDKQDELRAIAALPTQALKTFERYEAAELEAEGFNFLRDVSAVIRGQIATARADQAADRDLEHLRMSALVQLEDHINPQLKLRLQWLDWCLQEASSEEDPWGRSAAFYAIGDTAQSVNLMDDPSSLIRWCEETLEAQEGGLDLELSRSLETLLMRADNRRAHLEWRRSARRGQANCLTLLAADPSRPTPRTQRALSMIQDAHPDLKVQVRRPLPEDPPTIFSPQWTLYGPDGAPTDVFVGAGVRTQRTLLRALRGSS